MWEKAGKETGGGGREGGGEKMEEGGVFEGKQSEQSCLNYPHDGGNQLKAGISDSGFKEKTEKREYFS